MAAICFLCILYDSHDCQQTMGHDLSFLLSIFFALAATYDWVSGNCTNISLSWGLTYFANDDIILSMPRTDDLELVLRYWNFVSYSVCFLCSKLKVNRGATNIWGQCVEYYIIWSPSYYWYFVYVGYMPCTRDLFFSSYYYFEISSLLCASI